MVNIIKSYENLSKDMKKLLAKYIKHDKELDVDWQTMSFNSPHITFALSGKQYDEYDIWYRDGILSKNKEWVCTVNGEWNRFKYKSELIGFIESNISKNNYNEKMI